MDRGSPARTRCLLTHHRKLERWLQLGGHADGQGDVLATLRCARRGRSPGLTSLRAVSPGVFDCDVHEIPARGAEPAHFHYDVRFLLEADAGEPLVVSDESKELAWVALDDVAALGRPIRAGAGRHASRRDGPTGLVALRSARS